MDANVNSVMKKDVPTVDVGMTVLDAASSISGRNEGCLVVAKDSLVLGIVTQSDIVSKVIATRADPSKVYVRDIMTSPVITVNTKATLSEAAGLMTEYGVRRLVVVDDTGALAGLMSTEDLARWLAKENNFEDATLNALARLKGGGDPTTGPYR